MRVRKRMVRGRKLSMARTDPFKQVSVALVFFFLRRRFGLSWN